MAGALIRIELTPDIVRSSEWALLLVRQGEPAQGAIYTSIAAALIAAGRAAGIELEQAG